MTPFPSVPRIRVTDDCYFQGGHFAALEQPEVLWQDIVEFVDHVQSTRK